MRSGWILLIALAAALLLPMTAQAQTKAVPGPHPERWVTNDDYPMESLRHRERGIVSFRLAIDVKGRVSDCTVTVSSGYWRLDQTVCYFLKKRARFVPATDASGTAVPGEWSSRFSWWVDR